MHNNSPLISVIIPVYNVEKYLQRCIDSLKSQTYSNLEHIFINDKSTDSSLQILKENKIKDFRIKIYENATNSGASFSRNQGISFATGDYIGFVDSNDFVKETMFENLISKLLYYKCDISCCGIIRYDELTRSEKEILSLNEPCEFNNETALKDLFLQNSIGYSVYSKLFKKEIIKEINFPTDGSFEDIAIMPSVFLNTHKIIHIGTSEYYYVTRESSITTATVSEKNLIIYPRINKIEKEVKEYYPSIYSAFEYMRIINFSNLYIKALRDSISRDSDLFQTIKINYLKSCSEVKSNPYLTLKDKIRLTLLKYGLYKK